MGILLNQGSFVDWSKVFQGISNDDLRLMKQTSYMGRNDRRPAIYVHDKNNGIVYLFSEIEKNQSIYSLVISRTIMLFKSFEFDDIQKAVLIGNMQLRSENIKSKYSLKDLHELIQTKGRPYLSDGILNIHDILHDPKTDMQLGYLGKVGKPLPKAI